MISSNEALSLLNNVSSEINKLISFTKKGDFSEIDENIGYDETSQEERLLENEIYKALEDLDSINRKIKYLQLPILVQGQLKRNKQGRYVLGDHEFHCGEPIEVLLYDEFSDRYDWSISRMEHNGKDYYASGNYDKCLNNVTARIREYQN